MINLLFPFLAIISGSFFGCLYKKRFEETFAVSLFSVIVALYVFYIFNILDVGFYIICLFLLLIGVFAGYKFYKDKDRRKDYLSNFFTPGFFTFLIVFLIVYFVTKNANVLLWDELRLWGAYPKILFYSGDLQLGNDVQLINIMQSYNPGMPIFQYFFMKCFGTFNEGLLFLAYAILGASVLLPMTKNISWKKWYLIPVYAFGILLLPLLFANSNNDSLVYYFTLFIEPIMGILFGYAMFLTFSNVFESKFKYFEFILLLCVLVLLKDTGILFAGVAYVSFIISELVIYKKNKRNKFSWLKVLLPIILAFIMFGSWKLTQAFYQSENMYTSVLDKNEIVSLFTNPTSEQRLILEGIKENMINVPIVKSNFPALDRLYNFITMSLLLVASLLTYVFLHKRKEWQRLLIPIIVYFVGSLLYVLGTYFVYLFSIHVVASFPRYMSLIFTAGSVLIVLLLCCDLMNSTKNKMLKYYTLFLLCFCVIALPIRQPQINNKESLMYANNVSEEYSKKISQNISKNDDVLLVFDDSHESLYTYVIYHHQIYMDLLDEGFNAFDYTFVGEDDNVIDIIDDYDYVYFIVINNDDKNSFEKITDFNIEESLFFEVVKNHDDINLIEVN